MKHLKVRIPMYFIGLFIMTIGIALSVKSNLGVSPVSSIPYTITCVWGIEMGKATILFHIVLVLLQILLLRKKFKPVQLLQILIGVVFGLYDILQLYGILSSDTGQSGNPHCNGSCQHRICCIRYLFISSGGPDSTCRRGLYAGSFFRDPY